MESWKEIKDYKGYEVSNLGNVRTFKNKGIQKKETNTIPILLKQVIVKTHCKTYLRVTLRKENKHHHKYIHRLVALAFIDNTENKPQVNHKDNNPLNNELSNLEWCTNSENQIHRFNLSGTSNNYGKYIYKNRTQFRVNKKGVVDRCFKNLNEAQTFAKQYY